MTQAETYGRTARGRPFLAAARNDPGIAAMVADGNAQESETQDWADRVGQRASAIFIAALAALFAYAYLGPAVFR